MEKQTKVVRTIGDAIKDIFRINAGRTSKAGRLINYNHSAI